MFLELRRNDFGSGCGRLGFKTLVAHITKQSPCAADAHQRFLFIGEKICIDCHKGIAHHLPDMRGIPGWQ
jgi:nitrate/TMAO reductase-like tetraheme cytochrome c subunit